MNQTRLAATVAADAPGNSLDRPTPNLKQARTTVRSVVDKAQPVLRRLVGALVVIWGVVTVTFLLSRVFTAEPINILAPEDAPAEVRERIRVELGLDQSLEIQYFKFLGQLVRGNLGMSYLTRQPVADDLSSRLPATAELAVYALLIGVTVGLISGVVAAVWRGSAVDAIVRILTIGGLSIPQFWIGLVLIWCFFIQLGIAPGPSGRLPIGVDPPPSITGLYSLDAILSGQWSLIGPVMGQLALPVLTLSVSVFAPIARSTRSAMVVALDSDYVRTATAMGISRRRIWFVYALKNSLLAVMTLLASAVGWIFSGSVLVEGIFGWPGVGQYALNALQASDYPAVQGFVLYAAVLYVAIYAMLDHAYVLADPRMR